MEGLDKIFSHCEGYPELKKAAGQSRLAPMKSDGAFHKVTVGLSVEGIRMEARLRDETENPIDQVRFPVKQP